MKKASFVVVPLLLLSLYAFSASAQGGPRMHGMRGGMMGGPGLLPPFVLDKLALTDAQTAQVKGIMDNHSATFQSLFDQLKTTHDAMAEKFYASGALASTALTVQTQQVNQLQEQLMNEKLSVDLEIRAVLTPEQLAKAADIKNQMKAMHEQMKNLFQDS